MAQLQDFNFGQGETFRILTTVDNVNTGQYLDITDYTFVGQVRENYTTNEVAATFTFTKVNPSTSGSLFIELTPADTSALTQRKYVYDVKMTSGSVTRRLLEGYLVVRPAATR